jgi:phosphoglycolate phosphatase
MPNRLSRRRLLIFDLDGTIVDSVKDIAVALNHAIGKQGYPPIPLKTVKSFIGDGIDELLAKAVAKFKVADLPQIKADFTAHYRQHLNDTTELFPGILDILEEIRADKAILTNKRIAPTEQICRKLNITKFFKNISGADGIIKLKPDPQQLLKITAGYKPSRCYMIGDGINDLLAARSALINFIAVGYGYTPPHALKRFNPAYYVADTAALKKLLKSLLHSS